MRTTSTTIHELKTIPGYFQQVWVGNKTFEIRYEDRGYQRGDLVLLREWDRDWPCECPDRDKNRHDNHCAKYTGRRISARIGYVMAFTAARNGNIRGFNGMGYVVFSLLDCEHFDAGDADPPPGTYVAPERPADAKTGIAQVAAAAGSRP